MSNYIVLFFIICIYSYHQHSRLPHSRLHILLKFHVGSYGCASSNISWRRSKALVFLLGLDAGPQEVPPAMVVGRSQLRLDVQGLGFVQYINRGECNQLLI